MKRLTLLLGLAVVAGAVAVALSVLTLPPASLALGAVAGLPAGWRAQAGFGNVVRAAPPVAAPPLRFADGQGRAVTLDRFRGRIVVLNLWATWCAPCREEMPALARFAQAAAGRGIAVVALSVDQGPADKVRAFLDGIGAGVLEPYQDASMAALAALGVAGLPTTLVIDANGLVRGSLLGPADWNDPAGERLIEALAGN